MNVEMVGGPNDGNIYAVQSDRWLTIVKPVRPLSVIKADDAHPTAIDIETATLPILRRVRGNVIDHVVLWPKGWS